MKGQLVAVCIAALFVVPGAMSSPPGRPSATETSVTLQFSDPHVASEHGYRSVTVPEASSSLQEQGAPMLPAATHTFTFPLGTTVLDVSCRPSGRRTEQIAGTVIPAPRPVSAGTPTPLVFEENPAIYRSRSPYPGRWHDYRVGGGIVDGERATVVTVTVYPVQYAPAEGRLVHASEVDIEVRYRTPQQAMADPGAEMLIVTPERFSDALQPLQQHKESQGMATRLETLASIEETYEGRDVQEQIKYCIKDAVEQHNVSSVLLVGGSDELPVRYTHVNVNGDTETFPSDLYYADLYNATGGFSSWDANDNDIFGEYDWDGNTDDVDLYPDVSLGRLAAVSTDEVAAAVDKIVSYEAEEAYRENWFTRLAVAGGDSFTDAYGEDSGILEGEVVNREVLDVMEGFMPVKLWETNGKAYYLDNFEQAFDDGAGFVSFSGHGNPSVWATHALNGSKHLWIPTSSGIPGGAGGFRVSDIEALSNDELPIVVTGACSTSKFTERADCYGWSYLSNPNGGGIGSMGCTGLGYVYPGRYITQGLVGEMEIESFRSYAVREAGTLGGMWSSTVAAYIGPGMDAADYKTVEEWQLFGDPSLQIADRSQQSPGAPEPPEGPSSGRHWRTYDYTATAADPEGDDVYYLFDWGDGNYSGWMGPYQSGESVTASYSWESRGEYAIRVKAKDEHNQMSDWSDPLPVSMPKPVGRPIVQLMEQLFGWLTPVFELFLP